MAHAIGIDLGGTKTAAGVVSADGELLFSETTPTLSRAGGGAVLDATAALVAGLRLRAAADGFSITGVGVGSAGVIDAGRGVVVSATDAIHGWAGTPLTEGLARRLGIPPGAVRAVNDVHAHALGEAWRGAAAGTASSLLIAFGTGVGASLVLDGRPVLGHRYVGGHVGHIASPYAYADGGALPCSCGGEGHVEAAASGPAIHAAFLRLGGSPAVPDTRAVFALAHDGDPAARHAVRTAAEAAGQAAGGLANVLDPEVLVISGGLADAGDLWWNPMKAALRRELLDPLVRVPVLRATLENSAAIVGAAQLVFN
ncbi:ROK family protein [Arthrobacter humicola]|uniref:ROK family protein n=1 Tax=Arthrobacter humicola TaxID=409291 RepID=A0ABP5KRB5_9MICC